MEVHPSFVSGIGYKDFEKGCFFYSFKLCLAQDLRTALHVAAQEGRNETCEVLVQKGADVNAHDEVRLYGA